MTMLQRSNLSVEKSRSLPVEIKFLEQYDLQIANNFLLFPTSNSVSTNRIYKQLKRIALSANPDQS